MSIDIEVHSLLNTTRVGMLATIGEAMPLASAVPFVALDGWVDLLLHLSTLASHTQNLLRDPRVSLLIMEADDPQKNPLALTRLILQGTAGRIDRQGPTYDECARRFTERFPDAAITMTLADFQLWRLRFQASQFIAGFGRAYRAESSNPHVWQQQGRRDSKP
ncbi:MAG TPA: pyridoxamine 5'-phosphate oxidase family protein [Nitrospiraceae bacterium]|nr:pyridoxamine 5'-phosphate oxidase family protein [Nitrospiraceae bacterium]